MSKANSLKSNIAWNSIGSLVYLGCQWLITLLVVRLSSSLDAAGYLNLAISITAIFGTAASFNLRTYIISDTNGEISSGEYTGFRIVSCLISFVVCLIYSAFFGYSVTQYVAIIIYMLYRLTEAALDLFYAFEQKASRMDIGGKSMIARGVLSLLGFTAALLISQNILIALGAMVFATMLVVVLFDVPQARRFASYRPLFTQNYLILFRDGLLITVTSVISDFITTFPKQMIESVMGVAAVGAYTTVAAPVTIVQVGISFVFNPLLPLFDSTFKNGERDKYYRVFLKTVGAIVCIAIVALLTALLLGEPVLSLLYGNEIATYSYLLPTLILAISINALQWFIRILLVMMRVFIPQLVCTIFSTLLCCLISSPLIEVFGLMGANYVVLICYILSSSLVFAVFKICTKKHFETYKTEAAREK